MRDRKSIGLPLAATVSFLAVGIPYWLIPYGKLNLPDAVLGPGLAVVAISALLLRVYAAAALWRVIWMVGGSVAAAVMARVIVEAVRHPASHNLWPFELVIALALGLACSSAGAVTGSVIARYLANRAGDGDS